MAARFAPFPLRHMGALAALLLSACGNPGDGTLPIAWIGEAESLFGQGARLSSGAQHVKAATSYGLVAFDAEGDVIPALAEAWIVTDGGRSFIFRLRQDALPGDHAMVSVGVRNALQQAIASLEGTSLGLDLSPIREVRAMAGRVIEIRLDVPVPDLLVLLAQPELALQVPTGTTGPMTLERSGDSATLRLKPPAERGLPEFEGWEDQTRPIRISAASAETALALFDDGEVDIVLGGGLGHLAMVDLGPLSRGTIQLDPVTGLFGLRVRSAQGVLSEPDLREALAMAIDREALLASYNLGGWTATTRLVAPGLPGDPGYVLERWGDDPIEQRRARAASRIRSWQAGAGVETPVRVTVALEEGPGYNRFLRELSAQLQTVGIELAIADNPARADLVMVDIVARYADPRWFLNQFHCSLRRGLCSEDADFLVAKAQSTPDDTARATLLAEAEGELTRANVFIPIGAPLRWSLVRGSVDGFAPNSYALHALSALAELPR